MLCGFAHDSVGQVEPVVLVIVRHPSSMGLVVMVGTVVVVGLVGMVVMVVSVLCVVLVLLEQRKLVAYSVAQSPRQPFVQGMYSVVEAISSGQPQGTS